MQHDVLVRALLRVMPDPPPWLQWAIGGRVPTFDIAAVCFGGAGRELGHDVILIDPSVNADARAIGAGWLARGSNVTEVARVILARAIVAADPAAGPRNLRALYVEGDNEERAAISRTLGLIEDRAYTHIAQEACRSHVKPVFEAIACDNPFPARHFGERAFCQMVLKTFLFGTRVSRIDGLRDRTTNELFRMARDFASELRDSGRDVPDDIGELLALEGAA